MKVYIVLVSGYYNEEYWDTYTEVECVFSSEEKAIEYIKNIPGIKYNEESWKVGDEEIDGYDVRFYKIQEEEVKGL